MHNLSDWQSDGQLSIWFPSLGELILNRPAAERVLKRRQTPAAQGWLVGLLARQATFFPASWPRQILFNFTPTTMSRADSQPVGRLRDLFPGRTRDELQQALGSAHGSPDEAEVLLASESPADTRTSSSVLSVVVCNAVGRQS